MTTVPTTYTAVLVDVHQPDHRTTYPGLILNDDGEPAARLRIRYTGDLGSSRVTTYTLVEMDVEAGEADYRWESDDDYQPGPPDEDDWLIDAPGRPPQ